MLLKDAKIGRTYTVKSVRLPFQLERRLEALGMTRQTAISVLNRKGKGILIIKLRGTRSLWITFTMRKCVARKTPGDATPKNNL